MTETDVASPRERGMSLIELLIVIGIIGSLAGIAVPVYVRLRLQVQAAAIIANFRSVQTVANNYYLRHSAWPAERDAGQEPPELHDFLPGLDWQKPNLYDWDNLVGPNGEPTQPESGIQIGFSVRTRDERLIQLVRDSWKGDLFQTWGWGLTFPIQEIAPVPPVDTSGAGTSSGNGTATGESGTGNGNSNGNGNGNGNNGRGRGHSRGG